MGNSKDDNNTLAEIIRLSVKSSVKEAFKEYSQKKNRSSKEKYDRRLKNTNLLLKNYRNLVDHCEKAVHELAEDILDTEEDANVISMFDEWYDLKDDKTIIESILKSKIRTSIILKHITTCVDFYKYKAINSNDLELQRRVKVVQYLFLDPIPKTYEEIADIEHISTVTVSRDRKKAISELAVLIFGIDGLEMA